MALTGIFKKGQKTIHVFVRYNDLEPAMPCTPKRARLLLERGLSAIFQRVPFTIVLKHRSSGDAQPIQLKFDPGSKQTGVALVIKNVVVFAANIEHRGQEIKKALTQRQGQRGGRRSRNLRHRTPRFNNRRKREGWLPPSLQSRVDNITSWTNKLRMLAAE